jgi:hypothetical protein
LERDAAHRVLGQCRARRRADSPDERVATILPAGLEAYCRVLAPLQYEERGRLGWRRWSSVLGPGQDRPGAGLAAHLEAARARLPDRVEPLVGELDLGTLRTLARTLEGHTAGECLFYFWSGRGELRAEPASHLVYRGRPAALGELEVSPTAVWAADGRWALAVPPDAFGAYVAGPHALVEALEREPALETARVELETAVDGDA